MEIVNIHQAKTNLSRLIEAVLDGEEVIIAKSGKPKVKLVALKTKNKKRTGGQLKGKIWMADDWDSPSINKEIENLFNKVGNDPD